MPGGPAFGGRWAIGVFLQGVQHSSRGVLLAVVFLGLSGLTGALALGESRALGFGARGGVVPGLALSLAGDRAVLAGCLRAASSASGRLLVPPDRAALLTPCLARAETIATSAPDSFGWAVLAYLRRQTGDTAGFNTAMLRSYQSGANEGWVAALRLRLAETNWLLLTAEARRLHRQDLVLLLQSPQARGALARRYLVSPGFRARVSAALAAVPIQKQQEFLSILRNATRGGDAA